MEEYALRPGQRKEVGSFKMVDPPGFLSAYARRNVSGSNIEG